MDHAQWQLVKLDKDLKHFFTYVCFVFVHFLSSVAVKPTLQILVHKVFKGADLEQVVLKLIRWKLSGK